MGIVPTETLIKKSAKMETNPGVIAFKQNLDFPEAAFVQPGVLSGIFKKKSFGFSDIIAIRSNYYLFDIQPGNGTELARVVAFTAHRRSQDMFFLTRHEWLAVFKESEENKGQYESVFFTAERSEWQEDVLADRIVESFRDHQGKTRNNNSSETHIWLDWPNYLDSPLDSSASIHIGVAVKILKAEQPRDEIRETVNEFREYVTVDFPML